MQAPKICVCAGAGCVASGSLELADALRQELAKGSCRDLRVVESGCLGPCSIGPVVKLVLADGDDLVYEAVKASDAADIVAGLEQGTAVERLKQRQLTGGEIRSRTSDIPFFAKQTRIALRNLGLIDAQRLDDYVATGGYEALRKALTGMTPREVIETVKSSQIRGRGGAGFPTGLKWEMCARYTADQKYMLCNADEGDPGAFMDRSILEGDPHSVIEAMVIGGYAIGASQGYVYVRAEYPLAVERLGVAIGQARKAGYLGTSIFDSGFAFDLEIRTGAGAFVCGEETALMTSIEGKRGEPRPRPPFPAEQGLWGKPSVLNNVETLASIPPIITHGGQWYSGFGTEAAKGTKVFALAGAVRNTGLVEVPIGTTLREIIFDIGGGIIDDRAFKAVQMGGPSGGCIPAEYLDTPIDYAQLQALGAIMGSGGMIVIDETACMVDVARFFLEFTQDESCGKCVPCRVGTKRMLEIVNRICAGQGVLRDLDELEELGATIKDTSLCGLGQTAPNPVLSTLRHFRHEYVAHVRDRQCTTGVCSGLVHYDIVAELCKGCGLCKKRCPTNAISGELKQPYIIDQDLCISCGACLDACRTDAVVRS